MNATGRTTVRASDGGGPSKKLLPEHRNRHTNTHSGRRARWRIFILMFSFISCYLLIQNVANVDSDVMFIECFVRAKEGEGKN